MEKTLVGHLCTFGRYCSLIAFAAAGGSIACSEHLASEDVGPRLEESLADGEIRQTQQALSTGTYEIKAKHSNKCVDVANGSTAEGANIQQYSCNGTNAQKWTITDLGGNQHRIENVGSGLVMDADGSGGSGTNVHQWTNYNQPNQKWYIDSDGAGAYYIKPVHDSGQCLDVESFSTANYANVQTWACDGNDNKRFYITPVGGGGGGAPSWHTDFFDGFDGSSLNTGNWTVVTGTDGEFNNEAHWYVNEQGVENNYWVSGGTLVIKIQQENRWCNGNWCESWDNGGRWKGYTSTRLTTKGKKDFQNGAWEARLVFWAGSGADGVWPAFWLLGSNVNENPYPGSTCWPLWSAREIDVFEFTMNDSFLDQSKIITNFIQGTVCQQGIGDRVDLSVNAYEWHTYRVETKDGTSAIYVDGNWQRSVSSGPWENQNMHAILNVALGGNLGGPVAWNSGSWAGMTVDYVKHESWW